MQLVSAQEADTPLASSFQLNSALFSSTSALLAQLKLNNPEVAETYHAQGRVSYEHVDIMLGILHQSMHMHSMEIKERDVRDIRLARLKFRSSSTPLAQVKLNNPEVAETRPTHGRVSLECVAAYP
ncbi:hypothetical protein GQ457_02G026290 [Hibiscus cannabinus]